MTTRTAVQIHSHTKTRLTDLFSSPVADYRETAAKFQKEWHVKEPHRDFPFAPHVKGHALVSVVNRGLLYYALEREYAINQVCSLFLLFRALSLFCGRSLPGIPTHFTQTHGLGFNDCH